MLEFLVTATCVALLAYAAHGTWRRLAGDADAGRVERLEQAVAELRLRTAHLEERSYMARPDPAPRSGAEVRTSASREGGRRAHGGSRTG